MGDDSLLDEQLRYYDRRASSYDQVYARQGRHDRGHEANDRWRAELREVEVRLAAASLDGQVLELGCGTGHWTRHLAETARRVTAVDGSERMLEVARRRLSDHPTVVFQCTDLIRHWELGDRYDAVAAFFFLEHVPDQHIDSVVGRVSAAMRPGGRVFIAEGRYGGPAPVVQQRELDGKTYRVVERRRSDAELVSLFGRHGVEVRVEGTERRFTVIEGERVR